MSTTWEADYVPPVWRAEADKIKPTWPKAHTKKQDYKFQTDFPMKNPETYVDPDYPFKFVRRFDWGAKEIKYFTPQKKNLEYLVMEMTGTHKCMFHEDCVRVCRKLQEQHMTEKDVPDIKYNFLVGGDGVVYEGRGWDVAVKHTNPERAEESWRKHNWNGNSLIFAYIMPYDDLPTEQALFTMRDLIGQAIKKKYLKMEFLRIPGFFKDPNAT